MKDYSTTKKIEFEILEDNAIHIPFDMQNNGKYKFSVIADEIETGDGIILELDKKACLSFSKIFGQLGLGDCGTGYHVHLGYDQDEPQGPGFRIVLKNNSEATG